MKKSEYGTEILRSRDIMLAIPGMSLAIGVLYLPRIIASKTTGLDGLISISIGFLIALILIVMITKITSSFSGKTFMEYAPKLVSKPIATFISILYGLHGIFITAYEVRGISDIAHLQLFIRTPIVVVALAFFLVVIYGVSGSRLTLFRLNELFLPFVILVAFFVALLSLSLTNKDNMVPILQTDFKGFASSTTSATIALSGFGLIGYLFFYGSLVKKPDKPIRKAIVGISWLYLIYVVLYVACIVVFGVNVTANLMFPVVNLARAVEIPGGFFTRFESLFFVIWIMTIFNTSLFSFDIAILGFQSLFKNTSRIKMVFILAPIIFFIACVPKSIPEIVELGRVVSYFGVALTIVVTFLFFIILNIKGVKKNG